MLHKRLVRNSSTLALLLLISTTRILAKQLSVLSALMARDTRHMIALPRNY